MPLNDMGDRMSQTFKAWRAACRLAGAVRFEGDRDIAHAFGPDGKGLGEWDGETGYIFAKREPKPSRPLEMLRYHVTGAIERGEGTPIAGRFAEGCSVDEMVEAFLDGHLPEAFRPFKKAPVSRPFKMPDWARSEKKEQDDDHKTVKSLFPKGGADSSAKVAPRPV